MSKQDRKICFECGLDLGEDNKGYTENMPTNTVVGGWIAVWLCSKECRDQHLLCTKEAVSQVYH